MIAELRTLAAALRAAGIVVTPLDPRIVTLPNQPAYEVRVDAGGQVVAIRALDKELARGRRKFEASTGGSRPATPAFNFGSDDAMARSLGAATTLLRLMPADEPDLAPLLELLRRSRLVAVSALRAAVEAHAEGDPKLAKVLERFENKGKRFSIALELDDAEQYDYPPPHEVVWRALNRHLATGAATGSKLPEVKLPILGGVKLRSHSANLRCQVRYSLIEDRSYPVDSTEARDLASALAWAVRDDHRQTLWAPASAVVGKPTVLVAYPSSLPPMLPSLAGLIAGPEADEARFENYARPVVEALAGIAREEPRAEVMVFSLTKIDKARTQVRYSRRFAAARLIAAARDWQDAATNHPPVGIDGLTPFPGQLVRFLNGSVKRDLSKIDPVPGADLGIAMMLLLEDGPALRAAATDALRRAVAVAAPLLVGVGKARVLGRNLALPEAARDLPRLAPRVLGLLLTKSGSMKEAYMSENAYLVGRLLALADRLHLRYCKVVRDGDVPPELLGNSLVPVALDNPTAALARLAERLPLYYRYAHRWLRDEIGEVERGIDCSALVSRHSDQEKAQLLLGYIHRDEPDAANEDGTDEGTL